MGDDVKYLERVGDPFAAAVDFIKSPWVPPASLTRDLIKERGSGTSRIRLSTVICTMTNNSEDWVFRGNAANAIFAAALAEAHPVLFGSLEEYQFKSGGTYKRISEGSIPPEYFLFPRMLDEEDDTIRFDSRSGSDDDERWLREFTREVHNPRIWRNVCVDADWIERWLLSQIGIEPEEIAVMLPQPMQPWPAMSILLDCQLEVKPREIAAVSAEPPAKFTKMEAFIIEIAKGVWEKPSAVPPRNEERDRMLKEAWPKTSAFPGVRSLQSAFIKWEKAHMAGQS